MYFIKIEQNAEKFLEKISKKDKEIILNKIYSIKENPFRYLKKLQGSNLWRLRVLKYLVIIDVVVSGNKIVVLRIGLRKKVYN